MCYATTPFFLINCECKPLLPAPQNAITDWQTSQGTVMHLDGMAGHYTPQQVGRGEMGRGCKHEPKVNQAKLNERSTGKPGACVHEICCCFSCAL